MLLPQAAIQGDAPGPIEITKAAVLIAVRMLGLVLLPQQCQSDALARQFLMEGGPIRHDPWRTRRRRGRWIQPGFQLLIVQILRERPRQPRHRGTIERFRHRAPRHPTTGRNLPVTEPAGPFESQNVFDLSHGHSLRWHRSLLHIMEGTRYPRLRRTCVATGFGTSGRRLAVP